LAKDVGLPLVRRLFNSARRELFTPVSLPGPGSRRRRVTQRSVAPEVRSRVVTKLVEAIEETEHLAKSAAKRTKTDGGGISPKERWYQLMGYLAQALDGVLKNLDLESVKEKMDQMESASPTSSPTSKATRNSTRPRSSPWLQQTAGFSQPARPARAKACSTQCAQMT